MSAAYRRKLKSADPIRRRFHRLLAMSVGVAALFLINSLAVISALGLRKLEPSLYVGYFMIAAFGICQATAFYYPYDGVRMRARRQSWQRLQRMRQWKRQNQ